ncbi:MAG: WD40 repeat domain-containing protein [Trueperaceae bacterium]
MPVFAALRPSLSMALAAALPLFSFGWGQVDGGEVYAERSYLLNFGTLHSAAIAPDGRTIATAGSVGAVLWDLASGEQVIVLEAPPIDTWWSPGLAGGLAFAPDGSALYAFYDYAFECGPEFRRVVKWSLPGGAAQSWPGLGEAAAADSELLEIAADVPCHIAWRWIGNRELVLSSPSREDQGSGGSPLFPVLRDAGFEPRELRTPRRVGGGIVALNGRDLLFLDRSGKVLKRIIHAAADDEGTLMVQPGDEQLLLSDREGLKLFDVSSARLRAEFRGRRWVTRSADGRTIVTAGDEGVELRSLPGGEVVRRLESSARPREAHGGFHFSPSEDHLAREEEGSLTVWNARTGRLAAALDLLPGDWLWSVTYVDNESRAIVLVAPASLAWLTRHDGFVSAYRVVVLDLRSGEQTASLEGHTAYPDDLTFRRDGTLVVLGDNRHVRTFDLASGSPRLESATTTSDDARVGGERQLIADGQLILRARGGVDLALLPLGPEPPLWESDGELTITLPEDRLSGESEAALRGLVDELVELTEGSIRVPIFEYLPLAFSSGAWGRGAAIDRTGDWLAAVAGEHVRMINFRPVTREGWLRPNLLEVRRPLPADPKWGQEWKILPPDAIRFGEQRDRLVAYQELMPAHCFECHLYPSGLWLWDIVTGELLVLEEMPPNGTPVALDWTRLAAATGMWDAGDGERICEWPEVTAVALGPYIATGDRRGTVQLRDAETCAYLAPLSGHHDRIEQLEFSRDGRWLASRSRDGSVRVWPILPRR